MQSHPPCWQVDRDHADRPCCRFAHLHFVSLVQGGQIYGQFPTFELGGPNDTDTRGRWIPTLSIDQYGATLSSWFGIPASALTTVFPNLANFGSQNIGFLG